jgi:tRNA(Ile)-lysidine synthase
MASSDPTLNREHIRPGDRVCAAVSGGADSVALLMLLHEANVAPRNALGVGLSAVHVHHGLRGLEADEDLDFVQRLCLRLEVPLHVHRASVPDRIAASRDRGRAEGIEEAARALRYDFFASLLAEGHADAILTAHTLDDQAETVLMKLLRGAWTDGLSGIHPVVEVDEARGGGRTPSHPVSRGPTLGGATGRILRPLLGVRRAELEDYLRAHKQPWRTDSSNANEAFTRNRIRHQLLPILREFNPSLDQTLANLAELAREEEARWEAELARILPQVLLPGKPVRGGGRAVSTAPGDGGAVAIELDRLGAFDPAMRRRVVRAAASRLGARLSFDETARLLALAGFAEDPTVASRPGSKIQLAGGLRAERSARELRLSRVAGPKEP